MLKTIRAQSTVKDVMTMSRNRTKLVLTHSKTRIQSTKSNNATTDAVVFNFKTRYKKHTNNYLLRQTGTERKSDGRKKKASHRIDLCVDVILVFHKMTLRVPTGDMK